MRELPNSWSRTGNHPISSCAPVATTRSAVRVRAMRLGFASTRCTSWNALVAVYTLTRSPPSSVASAPQSAVVARILSAAFAGMAQARQASTARLRMIVFMIVLLELVRAVRANAVEILEEDLAIERVVGARFVPRVLRAQPRELARIPVEHERVSRGRGVEQRGKVLGRQYAGVDEPDVCRARIERVVARSDAPARIEAVHALQVPAGLALVVVVREVGPERVEGEDAALVPAHVLGLELERPAAGIVRGRPLERGVRDPHARAAGERVRDRLADGVGVFPRAVLGVRTEPRHARAPARRVADVAADVREQREGVHGVAARARGGEGVAVASLGAELEEDRRRREPLELDAVLRELP